MPILLHNWKDIIDLWKGALDASDNEALIALLECVPQLNTRFNILKPHYYLAS